MANERWFKAVKWTLRSIQWLLLVFVAAIFISFLVAIIIFLNWPTGGP